MSRTISKRRRRLRCRRLMPSWSFLRMAVHPNCSADFQKSPRLGAIMTLGSRLRHMTCPVAPGTIGDPHGAHSSRGYIRGSRESDGHAEAPLRQDVQDGRNGRAQSSPWPLMRRWPPDTSPYRMVPTSIIWGQRSAFATGWGRTSSRRARTAIRGSVVRRGTRAFPRASRQCRPRSDRAEGRSLRRWREIGAPLRGGYPSASSRARCWPRRFGRSWAKRCTPAKIEFASRCASAITSASSPPVSHWLSQSEVRE